MLLLIIILTYIVCSQRSLPNFSQYNDYSYKQINISDICYVIEEKASRTINRFHYREITLILRYVDTVTGKLIHHLLKTNYVRLVKLKYIDTKFVTSTILLTTRFIYHNCNSPFWVWQLVDSNHYFLRYVSLSPVETYRRNETAET